MARTRNASFSGDGGWRGHWYFHRVSENGFIVHNHPSDSSDLMVADSSGYVRLFSQPSKKSLILILAV